MSFRIGDDPRRVAIRSARPGRRGQAGLTLIEMVVALAVISIGVVGIVYGFSAVIRSSGSAQEQAVLDAAANDAADYLQSPQVTYQPCAQPQSYPSSDPTGTQWSITSVTWTTTAPPSWPAIASCGDYGIQEIVITVNEGSSSLTRTVWKAWPS